MLCPTAPALPWVAWASLPHLHGSSAPRRLPPCPARGAALGARFPIPGLLRWCVGSPQGSLAGRSAQIRLEEERRRDREAERLGGLEVNAQLELDGLLHRQVGGRGAFEEPIHVVGGAIVQVGTPCPIGHEATGLWIHSPKPVGTGWPLKYRLIPGFSWGKSKGAFPIFPQHSPHFPDKVPSIFPT